MNLRTLLLTACFLPLATTAAERTLKRPEVTSSEPTPANVTREITGSDDAPEMVIKSTSDAPVTVQLFILEKPALNSATYALSGEVSYENISGFGYLEMWNHFGAQAAFSRTMAEVGPLGRLTGSANARPFLLPFNSTGASAPVSKLTINLHLDGAGTVRLRKLKLEDPFDFKTLGIAVEAPPGTATHWLGIITGSLAIVLATAAEWLSRQGQSPAWVLGLARSVFALGGVAALAALIFLGLARPPFGWFSLLCVGVIILAAAPWWLRSCQQRLMAQDLRRIQAMDA